MRFLTTFGMTQKSPSNFEGVSGADGRGSLYESVCLLRRHGDVRDILATVALGYCLDSFALYESGALLKSQNQESYSGKTPKAFNVNEISLCSTKTPKVFNVNNPVQAAGAARGGENRRQHRNSVGVQRLPASCCVKIIN